MRPAHALLVVVVVVVAALAEGENLKEAPKGRAARTKRVRRSTEIETTTEPADDIAGTEPTQTIHTCTGSGENECAALINSECNKEEKLCKCVSPYRILDAENSYCGRPTHLNEQCKFTSECSEIDDYSVCNEKNLCVCGPGYIADERPAFGLVCITNSKGGGGGPVDTAMIGVLAGLALMFVIICVVLRLFSKARFRENRSIFNTPNPRLMNASLFKDSKLLSPARGDRRGSRASVRVPSRAASVTSVNAASRSPNGSLAKGRRESVLSTASATGSTHGQGGATGGHKTPSPVRENKKAETTVAIETVD